MIFCDMDGVIVNFDEGIKQLCGAYPWELARPQMWQKVIETPDYWVNLAQLPHAEALISYLRPKGFKILTGFRFMGMKKLRVKNCCGLENILEMGLRLFAA